MSEEEKIKELYSKYWEYMINKDANGLQSLMTDDYYLRHMTGAEQSRDDFIKGLMAGTFNYYSAEHDSIDVYVYGDSAEMVGKSYVLAAVYGGGKHRWRLRGDFTLRKENGNWKLTGSEASTF
ncbi:MAG: nuclear transport factor 2 family protein [Lachnospiraceae bacterium]|nr:nuclear transport factor 2 family protein [Lachnospiraceae bacterium]